MCIRDRDATTRLQEEEAMSRRGLSLPQAWRTMIWKTSHGRMLCEALASWLTQSNQVKIGAPSWFSSEAILQSPLAKRWQALAQALMAERRRQRINVVKMCPTYKGPVKPRGPRMVQAYVSIRLAHAFCSALRLEAHATLNATKGREDAMRTATAPKHARSWV